MLEEIEHNKVKYNNLSPELRAVLEAKVPDNGEMTFRRTQNPYWARVVPEDNPGAQHMAPMIGARMAQARVNITDPFSRALVKVVNYRDREDDGAPKDAQVIFPKAIIEISLQLDDALSRQSAAMFFLLPSFSGNILGKNGTPLKADAYDFELVDNKAIAEKRADIRFTVAEMNVRLKSLTLDQLRLVARATGYANADSDEGMAYMHGWVQAKIESDSIVVVQDAFATLDVLEIEDLVRKCYEKDFIYKDDATKLIRYCLNDTPIIAYNLNTDNQFRHLAEWLVKTDKQAADHLDKLKRMMGKLADRVEKQIQESVDSLLEMPPMPPKQDRSAQVKAMQEANQRKKEAAQKV